MKSQAITGKRSARIDSDKRHAIKNHLTAVKSLIQMLQIALERSADPQTVRQTIDRLNERVNQLIKECEEL